MTPLPHHPGPYIRESVIPKGVSVSLAAEKLGVSRPTLSNLLNKKAALSAEMAARLEQVFGASRTQLLQMQAAYNQCAGVPADLSSKTITYVPPFLAVRASDISAWASKWNLSARSRLAVLLRMLVNSTSSGLVEVDFPGNDDAERPGWDGQAKATEGSPWVPMGKSGWEFGCSADVQTKANDDYDKSIKANRRSARLEMTFLFVTPHRWPGKSAWVMDKRAAKQWQDVRAYDASDLEQWIEQSLPAQAWFADEIGMPSGVRSLDRCWQEWANVATPPLPAALFKPAIEAAGQVLATRLTQSVPDTTIIVADSIEEGLAFVAQAMGPLGDERLSGLRDRALVFDAPGALRKLADSSQPFIPVIHSFAIENELAPHASRFHRILIYPRNAHVEPHIVLEPIGFEALLHAFTETGKSSDEVEALARESGRSLTVLRRRLADSPGIRRPEWASNSDLAKQLVPLMLVGAWNTANNPDTQALSELAGCTTEEVEERFQQLVQLNDTPVWMADTYRGVVSKMDAMFAVAGSVTREMLQRYFELAQMVLGEDDPALDLAEDERAFASLYGKTRAFSKAFRDGISETLVLLSIHGHLFKSRGLSPDVQSYALFDALFKRPLETRALLASNADLPTYAEAVPERFIELIEEDLKRPAPAVMGLLKPVDAGIFGASPGRTGLLWALEGLAWNPLYLPRVVSILARLSEVEILDNWVNKPENSLRGIFRSWMPQTQASPETRVALIKGLKKRFPKVAWRLCLAQIGRDHMSASPSHKPRWRGDGYGYGRPVEIWEPIVAFEKEMLDLALSWESYTAAQISDLIEKMSALADTVQARAWSIVETWGREAATEAEKGQIVERIRVTTQTRRAVRRTQERPALARLRARAAAAMTALLPSDPIHRSMWLFTQSWIQESADEMEDDVESIDFEERDARIQRQRVSALQEIVDSRGTDGILDLVVLGKTSWLVGWLSTTVLEDTAGLAALLRRALARAKESESHSASLHEFVGGALRASWDHEVHRNLLDRVLTDRSPTDAVQLLLLAPFDRRTWALVETLPVEHSQRYWMLTRPSPVLRGNDQGHEGARRLLEANRPRAAFVYLHHDLASTDPQFLAQVLDAMANSVEDTSLALEHHTIEEAFKRIGGSVALTFEEKALLEYRYLEALVGYGDRLRDPGIPHLERYIEAHPELFVQMIAWQYKRTDGGQDPAALQVAPADVSQLAQRAHRLLQVLRRIPGHDESGALSADRLANWIGAVRSACEELGRLESADREIGALLAHAPKDPDGVWPCRVVLDVLEDLQSLAIMRGMHMGKHNSRGAHWRGEGGAQEREIADEYRKCATKVESTHPYVAAELLLAMAADYMHQAEREDRSASVRRRLS